MASMLHQLQVQLPHSDSILSALRGPCSFVAELDRSVSINLYNNKLQPNTNVCKTTNQGRIYLIICTIICYPGNKKIYTTFAMCCLVMDIPRSYLLYLCELMVELIRHAKAIQQVQGLHCTEHIWDPGGDGLWFETCPLQVAV